MIILPTSYICTYWQLHVWNGDLESQRLIEGAWPRLALTARLVAVTDRGQRRQVLLQKKTAGSALALSRRMLIGIPGLTQSYFLRLK